VDGSAATRARPRRPAATGSAGGRPSRPAGAGAGELRKALVAQRRYERGRGLPEVDELQGQAEILALDQGYHGLKVVLLL
jgi:hypothetical protein